MKKKHESDGPGLLSRSVFKILRVMKLMMVLICFIGLLSSFGKSYSQNTKLSVEFKNSSIESVLNYIESSTEYSFMYDNQKIDINREVNISAKDQTIEAIINQLFNNGVNYKMIGKHIIITPKDSDLSITSQQSHSVSGKVTDSSGGSLPGVSVVVKGTTTGVITDMDGKYTLVKVPENATLQFSFVGMKSQEVKVAEKTTLNITLEELTVGLEEVVAVGYGTVKKANLTGSVSSVSTNLLNKSSVTNSANLLQGRIGGLEVIQPTGKPGNDSPTIRIRGLGSYGASSTPLVLIDGVIGSLSDIAPNDIENVTILKDAASASIYGARAANGVILLTTKNAKKGEASLEYKLDVGLQNATSIPDLIWDSGEYMEMYNSARLRSGLSPFYTQNQINDYKNATDRVKYPNFNWPKYYFKTATNYNHALDFSKATENSRFRLGLTYYNQDGILPVFKSERFTTNLNYESQILKAVKIGTTVNFYYKKTTEPQGNSDDEMVRGIYARSPLATPFLPDGSGRKSSGRAYSTEPFSTMAPIEFTNGDRKASYYSAKAQVFAVVDIMKGLQWETKGAFNYAQNFSKVHTYATPGEFYFYQKLSDQKDYIVDQSVGAPMFVGVSDGFSVSITPTIYSTLKFNTKINDHEINTMVGYEQQSNNSRVLSGKRINFPTSSLAELNAGSSVGQSLGGTVDSWALQSLFGRIAYNYQNKYLLESNIRYDGTSRVQADHRWGLFPSLSGGWRVSEENFMKSSSLKWINNLKLRGSYGLLGNQEIGLYPYQDIFNYASYSYGNSDTQGVVLSRMTDKNLKWEKTGILDFGLDVDAFNGLIGLGFDWYKKDTYDILTTLPVPASIGLSGPTTNNGALRNTGIEFELRHNNNIGELHYGINFNISGFRNKLMSIVTPTEGINEVGLPYNSFYIYEWDGIFQSQEEIDNSAKQNNHPKPGDLKIKDQNGDNIVDAKDRVSYSRYPKYNYSLDINFEWRRWNLSIFLQGVEGSHVYLSNWATFPFREGIPPKAEFRNAWTQDNHSNTIPAVHEFSYQGVYGYSSTYLFRNSSYLRLKNIYLSYSLPENILKTIKVKGMSVSVSGSNLLTITGFNDGDPEVAEGTTTTQYPQLRSINFGINIKF